MKSLTIQLEKIDNSVPENPMLTGKCVVCSEDFDVLEKPVRKKGPRSRTKVTHASSLLNPCGKDFKFVLEKCLEGSEKEWRRVRRKDGFSGVFCPVHADIVLEGRRLEEQMEELEKLLRLQKKIIRDAVVESFLLEGSSWSSVSSSPRLRQYKSLRTILRDVSSKYILEDEEVDVKARSHEDTSHRPGDLSLPMGVSSEEDFQVEVKDEPLWTQVDLHDPELPLIDFQEPLEHPQLPITPDETPQLLPKDISRTEDDHHKSHSPLMDPEVANSFKFGRNGPDSPLSNVDYTSQGDEDLEDELEDSLDDQDYQPSSETSNKRPKRISERVTRQALKITAIGFKIPKCRKEPTKSSGQPRNKRKLLKKSSIPKITLCRYCDANFDSCDVLLVHIKSKHGDKKYVCKTCGKLYASRDIMEGHQRRDHERILEIECDICHKKYATVPLMRDHRRFHFHDATPVACPLHCGTTLYKGKRRLALHMKYAHSSTPSPRNRAPDLHCPDCDKTYRKPESLKYHRAKVHLKTNPKVVCDICGKELSDNQSLKKHRASQHLKEFKYQCHLCPTQCLFKSHLDVHFKSAHGSSDVKSYAKKGTTK